MRLGFGPQDFNAFATTSNLSGSSLSINAGISITRRVASVAPVVVASHWAADRGFAVRRIQRLSPVQVCGDWRKMLGPITMPGGAPRRICVADVFQPGEELPADILYIGHSHFSHRLPTTKRQCPFLVGRDGSQEHVAFRFLDWFPFPKSSLFSSVHGPPF